MVGSKVTKRVSTIFVVAVLIYCLGFSTVSAAYGPVGFNQGTVSNIVLFIDFADEQTFYSMDTSYYDGILNSNSDSLKNYYSEVSRNQLTINSYFPNSTATIQPYRATENFGYYQPYSDTNTIGYTSILTDGRARIMQLFDDTVAHYKTSIESLGVNVDIDNNGYVDSIMFLVPGSGVDYLSAHMTYYDSISTKVSGANISNSMVINNRYFSDNATRPIQHEYIHNLGTPDFYAPQLTPAYKPTGAFEMADNGYGHPTMYTKKYFLGWIDDEFPEITTSQTGYELNPVTSQTNNVLKIKSPYSNSEYFLVEFRKKEGVFESKLPAEGLLVYRINKLKSLQGNFSAQTHSELEVYAFRTDGTINDAGYIPPTNGDPQMTLSQESGRTSLGNDTNPRLFLSNGNFAGITISNVSSSAGSTMTFDIDIVELEKPVINGATDNNIGTTLSVSNPEANVLYTWETSSDNVNFTVVESNSQTYQLTRNDSSKYIRVKAVGDGVNTPIQPKYSDSIQLNDFGEYIVNVVGGTGSGSFKKDATVTITATVPSDQDFDYWQTTSNAVVFADRNSETTTFSMPSENVTVTAVFKDKVPTVTSVTVSPTSRTIQVDTDYTFSASVLGENNPSQAVTWSVSGNNSGGTTINESGKLHIADDETASTLTVTATSTVDNTQNGNATVTVSSTPVDVGTPTDIVVTPSTARIKTGNSFDFSAVVNGDNEPSQEVTWSIENNTSNDTTVDNNGNVTIGSDEVATTINVIATSVIDTSISGSATVTVVNPASAPEKPVFRTNLPNTKSATQGSRLSLDVTVSISDNGRLTYQWYKDDELIEGETNNHLSFASVTLEDAGDYHVLVTNTLNGLSETVSSNNCTVTVNKKTPSGGGGGGGGGTLKPIKEEPKDAVLPSESKSNLINADDVKVTFSSSTSGIIATVTKYSSKVDDALKNKLTTSSESNKSLLDDILNIALSNNGNSVYQVDEPFKATIDISKLGLTETQLKKLTAVYYDAALKSYVQIGGEVSADGKSFTFSYTKAGNYGLIVSNDLRKIELTIDDTVYSVNGVSQSNDVAPIIQGGRTLVPIRVISESLGANVTWNADTRTVTVIKDGKTLTMTIGEPLPSNMGTPEIINGRTYVPIRYIAEQLGANVIWDNVNRSITIYN